MIRSLRSAPAGVSSRVRISALKSSDEVLIHSAPALTRLNLTPGPHCRQRDVPVVILDAFPALKHLDIGDRSVCPSKDLPRLLHSILSSACPTRGFELRLDIVGARPMVAVIVDLSELFLPSLTVLILPPDAPQELADLAADGPRLTCPRAVEGRAGGRT